MGCTSDWLLTCRRPPGATADLYLRSTFVGSVLECHYQVRLSVRTARDLLTRTQQEGKASFASDSMSVISILQEVISKSATQKKITIQASLRADDDSLSTVLHLLRPKLDRWFLLERKQKLIPFLKVTCAACKARCGTAVADGLVFAAAGVGDARGNG